MTLLKFKTVNIDVVLNGSQNFINYSVSYILSLIQKGQKLEDNHF